jgi:predicted AlkP superfamily pyrophosphatase or phosphodiesterase
VRWGLLVALALGACARAPRPAATVGDRPSQPVVLVSLDGFRWDYLDRPYAIELRKLAARGVRATRMVPVFPSKTFPNHYSIVTGLYPAHHGIISNTMWDDEIGRMFSLSARDVMLDTRWWGGEPLWVTAVKQGKKSASFFWPGADVPIAGTLPTYYRVYDGKVPNAARVQGLLDWLSLPGDSAPIFATIYFNDVDDAGHDFGPDAPQVDSAIARVDTAVGALASGLAARGLDRVNVIVLADHGMTATSPDRQIFLDDYIDSTMAIVVDLSVVTSITPRDGHTVEELYQRLHGRHPQLSVYRRAELPARWHYAGNPRITPIVAVAAEGWKVVTHARPLRRPGGDHGYDNALPSMGALFLAAGPAFKRGAVVPPFQNIHLYELMARITGLEPASNDGSLDSVRALLR